MTPAETVWRVVLPTLAVLLLTLVAAWALMGCSEREPGEPARCVCVERPAPADVDGVLQDVLTDLEAALGYLEAPYVDHPAMVRPIVERQIGRLQGLLHHSQGQEPGQGAEP